MPDFNNFETVDLISEKSEVLYIGCDLEKFNPYKQRKQNKIPLILWNHRWEFDKNPESFFNVLFKLKDNNIDFDLAVLGEKFKEYPKVFDKAKKLLASNIVQFGFCDSFDEYAKWLWKADILPVTSKQDFFGISVIEASYCNTYPLLPNRLTYPELFNLKKNPTIFYKNEDELYIKLKNLLTDNIINNLKIDINRYDWSIISSLYDETFSRFV